MFTFSPPGEIDPVQQVREVGPRWRTKGVDRHGDFAIDWCGRAVRIGPIARPIDRGAERLKASGGPSDLREVAKR